MIKSKVIWMLMIILITLFNTVIRTSSVGSCSGSSPSLFFNNPFQCCSPKIKGSTMMKKLERLVTSKGKTCPQKLSKFCSKQPNLTLVLEEAVTQAIDNCHEQFRFTRWNCTLDKKLFENVSRETSVVTGMFAASLTHAFARSCELQKFSKCNELLSDWDKLSWKKKHLRLITRGDDLKFGRRMAKRILIGNFKRKKRKNFDDIVSVHNVRVGLRAAGNVRENCHCQSGYSPTCKLQICKKSLTNFEHAVKVLRSRYTEARMADESEIFERSKKLARIRDQDRFYYTTQSPNFCKETRGRECLDEMNCSVLCCARGFKVREIETKKKCRCVTKRERCCSFSQCKNCSHVAATGRKYICK